MARTIKKLFSTNLNSLGPGTHSDGHGLYLQVKNGRRSWVFRYMLNGQARYMGLGPYPDVSLAEARRSADTARALRRSGIDPIEERRQKHKAARTEVTEAHTFEMCARQYIASHEASWRNAKHRAQWTSTLEMYVFPVFGSTPVHAIDTALVMEVLSPIWATKPETANRVRGRIEAILNWAKTMGYRGGENPAQWRGHLSNTLPKRTKVRSVKHHEAMPYALLPAFFSCFERAQYNFSQGARFHDIDGRALQ